MPVKQLVIIPRISYFLQFYIQSFLSSFFIAAKTILITIPKTTGKNEVADSLPENAYLSVLVSEMTNIAVVAIDAIIIKVTAVSAEDKANRLFKILTEK
jgi:hypothetical protein